MGGYRNEAKPENDGIPGVIRSEAQNGFEFDHPTPGRVTHNTTKVDYPPTGLLQPTTVPEGYASMMEEDSEMLVEDTLETYRQQIEMPIDGANQGMH